MTKKPTGRRRLSVIALVVLCLSLCLSTTAFADTDGTEPKITQQPDQLVLQLGVRWAGVEFELRTDAGIFPAPVVVDETGVLRMDLGGSTTYTLSCMNSTVPIPDPVPEQTPVTEPTPGAEQPPAQTQPSAPVQQPPAEEVPQEEYPEQPRSGIPTSHLVLFLGGVVCAVGGLVAMRVLKQRRQDAYEDWDEDDEEEY